MNLTPAIAVLAAQWRRSRWVIVSACLSVFSLYLILAIRGVPLATRFRYVTDPLTGQRAIAEVRDVSVDLMASILLIFLTVAAPLLTILFIQSDSEKLHVSLPTRVMRLPFATWKLVGIYMGYGLAVVAAVSLLATLLTKAVMVTEYNWWIPPVLAACTVAILQSWAFVFGDTNPKSAAATLALGIAGAVLLLRQEAVFTFLSNAGPAEAFLAAATVSLFAYAFAVFGVRINRRGGFPDLSGALAGRRSARVRAHPFKSATEAQRWYERRLYGWQLPLVTIGIMLAYFFGMPLLVAIFRISNVDGNSSSEGFSALFEMEWWTSPQFVTTGMQLTAIVSGVLVGGLMFMRAGTWNRQSSYLLTRPLSTQAIARARLAAVFRSVSLSLGIMIAAVLITSIIVQATGDGTMGLMRFLRQGYEHVPNAVILIFFWGTLLIAIWVGIWSVNLAWALAVFAATILPTLAVVWILHSTGATTYADTEAAVEAAIRLGARLGAPILIVGAIWAYVGAERLRLLPGYVKWVAAGCWAGYSLPFIYYGLTFNQEKPRIAQVADWAVNFPHPIDWVLWAGLSVIPIAPLFSHAFFLERARHQ